MGPRSRSLIFALAFTAISTWLAAALILQSGTWQETLARDGVIGVLLSQSSLAFHAMAVLAAFALFGRSSASADWRWRERTQATAAVAGSVYLGSFMVMFALSFGGIFTMGCVGLIALFAFFPSAIVLAFFVLPMSLGLAWRNRSGRMIAK